MWQSWPGPVPLGPHSWMCSEFLEHSLSTVISSWGLGLANMDGQCAQPHCMRCLRLPSHGHWMCIPGGPRLALPWCRRDGKDWGPWQGKSGSVHRGSRHKVLHQKERGQGRAAGQREGHKEQEWKEASPRPVNLGLGGASVCPVDLLKAAVWSGMGTG